MEIRSLADTNLSDIVACLLEAFEGYFVKMPESIDYWEERFRGARVEYELSFGMFDQDRLVAFIMNGIDIAAILLRQIHLGLPESTVSVMKGDAPEAYHQTERVYPLAKTYFAL